MKNLAILFVGVIIGYFVFSFLNPQPVENFTVKTRTIKQTNTVPVEVKETRYHGQETGPLETKTDKASTEPLFIKNDQPQEQIPQKKVSQAVNSKEALKAFFDLQKLPYLSITDSRIVSLNGIYTGKFKLTSEGRTGKDEKAILTITDTLTELSLKDKYDNPNEEWSFNFKSDRVFKAMPGDLNLILIETQISSNYFIIDLRALPVLRGKAYSVAVPIGDIELKRK